MMMICKAVIFSFTWKNYGQVQVQVFIPVGGFNINFIRGYII